MAKKLLSLLCAVTLIVSMVTIIATTVKLFSDNPTLSTSDTNHHGVLAPTYAPDSNYGFDTVLHMSSVYDSVTDMTVTDANTYNLGNSFTTSFKVWYPERWRRLSHLCADQLHK